MALAATAYQHVNGHQDEHSLSNKNITKQVEWKTSLNVQCDDNDNVNDTNDSDKNRDCDDSPLHFPWLNNKNNNDDIHPGWCFGTCF